VVELRLPYGKFRGRAMHQIPSGYLKWVAESFGRENICVVADEEWQYREKYTEHWEEGD